MTKPVPLLALAAAALAGPAIAQTPVETGDDSYNMVIVYGDDACPESTADQIVVCARKNENERFRIPERLRFSDNPANEAWAQRVEQLEYVGASGIMSCSPVGAGGFTGCTQELIRNAYADKENSSEVRFGQLVAEARAERLEGIDAEAAEEQDRVEMIERDYMERLERERAGQTPDEAAADDTTVAGMESEDVTSEEDLVQPPEM
ncbi:hypothetical protein K3172_01730 [Qipengyuania sp. 6B39]|uniref:hypothetical protein n=1 Tax=Qipengyuania proteolytica TaxID=2867239 RepID=UPI001C8AC538|nr:hypothetical protein [Qipengyuania proteolytica]MBX7494571.1 hypothetical protein [Qipengyuania proteolytica]